MEIRNNADAMKAFLGVSSPSSTQISQTRSSESAAAEAAFGGDRATLSQAGTEVSQAADQAGIRSDKVAAVQQALAAGTYSVPASKVADKLIDSMVAGGIGGRD